MLRLFSLDVFSLPEAVPRVILPDDTGTVTDLLVHFLISLSMVS